MKFTRKLAAAAAGAAMLAALTACSAGPDLPMELTMGDTVVTLGQTTMQDLIDLGYEPNLEMVPDTAEVGDEFITFDYSMSRGAGDQFWVGVCMPWDGDTDISQETTDSATQGIVRTVTVTLGSVEDVGATYNGMDVNDISFQYAEEEWGAEVVDESRLRYEVEARDGLLSLEAEFTGDDTMYRFAVRMYQDVFDKMQAN